MDVEEARATMHVAYHFDADSKRLGGMYGEAILLAFCRELLSAPWAPVHLKVHVGDLLAYSVARAPQERIELCEHVLCDAASQWLATDPQVLFQAMLNRNVYVIALECVTASANEHIHDRLCSMPEYYGALQLAPRSEVHWRLYSRSLCPKFRYLDRSLRLFYSDPGGDDRNELLAARLRVLDFEAVTWENTGLRHTIFDDYASHDWIARNADLSEALGESPTCLFDDVLMQLSDRAPKLCQELQPAFRALSVAATSGDVAQVAVNCRRFLEGLADALYPPRDGKVDGHSVGEKQHKNRLFAYWSAHPTASAEDIGARIERLFDAANTGVHADLTPVEARGLAMGAFVLAHDLLVLEPPPECLPLEPHKDALNRFLQAALGPDQSPTAAC